MGGFNPVHYGHIALIETGLKEVEQIDLLVGSKKKYVLPRDLRVKTLESVLKNRKLDDRVNIMSSKPKLKDYDVNKYSTLILGSDVLNHFPESQKVHRPQDRAFFSQFSNLVILEREGIPIITEARELANKNFNVIEYPSISSIAAKIIRANYRNGENVSNLMPAYVWEQIEPHADLFHQSLI